MTPSSSTPSLPRAPKPSRSPWQKLYEGAHRLRASYYRDRAHRLDRPVISVGNLHWGGSGKTPLVAAIASDLTRRGLRVAILSRGYGSRGTGVRVAGRGEGKDPRQVGDEPLLLAKLLPDVQVFVCPDRYEAGRRALDHAPRPDLFLLDDGFSHLRLARDLDLLAFPASDPYGGGRLPPFGRLREPLYSAARADAVLLTGAGASEGPELARELEPYGFEGPGFSAPTEISSPRSLDGEPVAEGTRVLLVSAIARPELFRASAESRGLEIVGEIVFRDHHAYPEPSLRKIAYRFADSGADRVLVTSKDRVKLEGRLDLPLADLPVVCRPQPELFSWLAAQIKEASTAIPRRI